MDSLTQLKKVREDRQLTLHDVSDVLRISVEYLDALERKDYGKLPERVYTIGFLRNYANYLDLNSEDLVRQFRSAMKGENESLGPEDVSKSSFVANLRGKFWWAKLLRCSERIVQAEIMYFVLIVVLLILAIDFLLGH
ncbi:MAG: helix-turn-helix domain-containing protein [Holosporaceae bacterium]|jgi:cytoskeletal protein RodZ|nr:helix-turn-helix domain-containing protein [Holosporaceae bacterium]